MASERLRTHLSGSSMRLSVASHDVELRIGGDDAGDGDAAALPAAAGKASTCPENQHQKVPVPLGTKPNSGYSQLFGESIVF